MAKKFPISPKHPERICWGCDKFCKADDLLCGNGCERIQHPIELDGPEWYKNGDWNDLLSEEQLIELGLKSPAQEAKTTKPFAKHHNYGYICALSFFRLKPLTGFPRIKIHRKEKS